MAADTGLGPRLGEVDVRRAISDVLCQIAEHAGPAPVAERLGLTLDDLARAAAIGAELAVEECDALAVAEISVAAERPIAWPIEDRAQRVREARRAWVLAYLVARTLHLHGQRSAPLGEPWITACIYGAWPEARERQFAALADGEPDVAILEAVVAGRGLRRPTVPFIRQVLIAQCPHALIAARHAFVCASR